MRSDLVVMIYGKINNSIVLFMTISFEGSGDSSEHPTDAWFLKSNGHSEVVVSLP